MAVQELIRKFRCGSITVELLCRWFCHAPGLAAFFHAEQLQAAEARTGSLADQTANDDNLPKYALVQNLQQSDGF